jgi:hypothetical protein
MTQNNGPIEDLQVRRTRRLLQQALIALTFHAGIGVIA